MNLNLQAGGSVELSEAAFGHEFNEPLVHQWLRHTWRAGGKGAGRRSRVHNSVGADANPGGRRALGALAPVPFAVPSGAAAASPLPPNPRIMLRK